MDNSNSETINIHAHRSYWKLGEPMVWLSGAALASILAIAVILVFVIISNGLGVFWPSPVARISLLDGGSTIGELTQRQQKRDTGAWRQQIKTGNRDFNSLDFRWIEDSDIKKITYPANIIALERMEFGNFYGFLREVNTPSGQFSKDLNSQFEKQFHFIAEEMEKLEDMEDDISSLSNDMESLRLKKQKLEYHGVASGSPELAKVQAEHARLQQEFEELLIKQSNEINRLRAYTATFEDISGKTKSIPFLDIVRYYYPNTMSFFQKVGFYIEKLWELLAEEPREANTEGGLFPAIFGTVLMVIIMSFLSFPLGVITAIYMGEYAKDGVVNRMVHIAVHNLAGIPSIVYGVFGLGFFVYGIGGTIDTLFFPERLPTPTFGSGGILWASLTLGLLTVPVVIVATEEALSAVPKSVKEGSLALGATKFQTLIRVILPMASPGIMTGFILAIARAAGEVAPLMITGVVKLAPTLALDSSFPYLHLERKFMHLGFHIYDVGFQSPNVEAAKPMVFVTTFLLVMIVMVMSSLAIVLRNRLKERYTITGF
ncbi:MAG: phosphate ABC transporter permease PstA [SAR324 cluster bacterium]|nr:phosphate ABC transporter permease PstA [SAR324 cluster bacterium]